MSELMKKHQELSSLLEDCKFNEGKVLVKLMELKTSTKNLNNELSTVRRNEACLKETIRELEASIFNKLVIKAEDQTEVRFNIK